MNRSLNKKIFLSVIVGLVSIPSLVSATTIYFDTKQENLFAGDNIVVDVRVDSGGKEINAVEGKIFLDYTSKNISVGDLSVAGSVFPLWPQKPSLSLNEKEISFVGGIPEGVSSKDSLAFKVIINLEKPGKVTLKTSNFVAYLNDGKGTRDSVITRNFDLEIAPKPEDFESRSEWPDIIEKDQNPPKPFVIYLGQEGSVFDGKKFLAFNTTDDESGLAYYDVIEGDLSPVRSGNTYVLQEQNKPIKVIVQAYDFAGNVTESIYNPTSKNTSYSVIIIFIILIIFVAIKMRKVKNEIV